MGSSPSTTRLNRPCSTPIPSDLRFPSRPTSTEYRVTILHPNRLQPNRVTSVCVQLAPEQRTDIMLDLAVKKPLEPIPLRLLVPGALVTPQEHAIEPSPNGPVEVMFHVTPLAEGSLPDARLEVYRNGQFEMIPVHFRCETPRGPWWGAFLTIVVAILLHLPTCWPTVDVAGPVSRWLPRVVGLNAIPATLQHGYRFLATTGHEASLSFLVATLGLTGVVAWVVVTRRRVQTVAGATFTLDSNVRATEPPGFLHPVSEVELGSFTPRR